jgi:hypothetical protein
MNSSNAQSVVVEFILGAAGTVIALWLLFVSYREATALRDYVGLSGM